MAKPIKRPPKAAAAFAVQPVVIQDCVPYPNPVVLSTDGVAAPNQVYFTTQDHDRVYEVKIKGGVFVDKPNSFKLNVWFGTDSETLTVKPNAIPHKFRYDVKAAVGPACPRDLAADPPEIIIEN